MKGNKDCDNNKFEAQLVEMQAENVNLKCEIQNSEEKTFNLTTENKALREAAATQEKEITNMKRKLEACAAISEKLEENWLTKLGKMRKNVQTVKLELSETKENNKQMQANMIKELKDFVDTLNMKLVVQEDYKNEARGPYPAKKMYIPFGKTAVCLHF